MATLAISKVRNHINESITLAHTWKRRAISESIVVDMIIGFLLVAILFPIAQNQVVGATTTNWNSSVITMFEVLLPILVIVAIVYHFIK